MSDIKLFRTSGSSATELLGSAVTLEKSLQSLIERNMEAFLGVRFLASEFVTTNGGRMDSLGIDENDSPVIIEYKRASNENIINQGLFYLDWLMDHRRDFEWLVMDRFGVNQAKTVLTSASQQVSGDAARSIEESSASITTRNRTRHKTFTQYLADADEGLVDLFEAVKAYLVALGDDVQIRTRDNYMAFRRLKNFACVEIKPQVRHIKVFLKVDPGSISLEAGFSRDVRSIGHFGTGDLEIIISDIESFERAKPLMERSYDGA